jgi:hypothetical protein
MNPDDRRRMGEQRRYFPDWTPQVLESCAELEADHNSYLAGGYAEEFGYRAEPGYSRGVPVLDGESPEQCPECRAQAMATHPGYPLRSHPLDVELDWSGSHWIASWMNELDRDRDNAALDAEAHGVFAPVSERSYERERHEATRTAAAVSQRLAAALVSLRWTLTRHH